MNQENITRTLATGQSDITRHEAFTKAQGLNLANANAPKYVAVDKFNGYEYVDLGLPSGTLWAKCNVGASSETDGGFYFAWGETQGYTADQVGSGEGKRAFIDSEYKFGKESPLTKYDQDGLTELELTDDAAAVNMGGDWHMPTKAQYEELFNTTYVTNAWVENYNGSSVPGCLLTSVNNGNTLFIPSTGHCYDGAIFGIYPSYGLGNSTQVWSSSLFANYHLVAWYGGHTDKVPYMGLTYRSGGNTVRGVIG